MKINEAVEYLKARDYRCSASTVRKLVKAGKLPCFRPGLSGKGRMEFRAERLDAFLLAAELGTTAPPLPPPGARPPRPKPAAKPVKPDGAGWRDRMAKVVGS
jgi:hypothetical protein